MMVRRRKEVLRVGAGLVEGMRKVAEWMVWIVGIGRVRVGKKGVTMGKVRSTRVRSEIRAGRWGATMSL